MSEPAFAPSQFSRRNMLCFSALGLTGLGFGCRAPESIAAPTGALDVSKMGCVGDGRTDNGAAFSRAMREAATRKLTLYVPPGIFLIEDRFVAGGGAGHAMTRDMRIHGSGAESVLRFVRRDARSFYGLAIEQDGARLSDLVIEVDRAGTGWAAGVAVTKPVRDIGFTRVIFRGRGGRAGLYGIMPLDADIDGCSIASCRFEGLDFGYAKQSTDVSIQSRFMITDCIAENCTEGLEFNSPGLFFGRVIAGSPVIAELSEEGGAPFAAGRLRVGQPVRGIAFPDGAKIVSIDDPRRITLDRPALRNVPLTRLSAGGCRDGVIRNFRARDIGQWALGFSNCENWAVEAYGEDIAYELVHVEDGSRNFRIRAGGERCNLKPGVVGSAGASNGLVHISTGSRDMSVFLDKVDLRRSGRGNPHALCLQAGGPMGTTGEERDPVGITVSGHVIIGRGTHAIIAYNSELFFDNFVLEQADASVRQQPLMKLFGGKWSGRIRVRNSDRIVETNADSRGHFDSVERF